MFDLLFTTSASWSRSLGFCDWFSRLLMAGRHQSANCAAGSAVAGTLPRALLGPRHTEGGEGHHKGGPPAWVQSGWCLACHGISKIHQVPAGCHPVLLEVLAGACWWMLLLYLRAHGLQCAESWIRSLLERNLEKLWWKWSLTFGSFMFMSNINMFDIWTSMILTYSSHIWHSCFASTPSLQHAHLLYINSAHQRGLYSFAAMMVLWPPSWSNAWIHLFRNGWFQKWPRTDWNATRPVENRQEKTMYFFVLEMYLCWICVPCGRQFQVFTWGWN